MIKQAVSAFVETEKSIVGKKNFSVFSEYFNKKIEEAIELGNYHTFIPIKDIEFLTGSEYSYALQYVKSNGYKIDPPIQGNLRICWDFNG